jgi:pimeloyl-ACP methyl ester carboxylesterase
MDDTLQLRKADGSSVAYRTQAAQAGKGSLLWLCGFHSEMNGTKATAIGAWAERTGYGYTRFDYFGHGASSGDFRDGTISRWLDDSLSVVDRATTGELVLVGSSMGAWIALLVALARRERVKGMVLIAPAPDFTEVLLWQRLPDDARRQIEGEGVWLRPSAYDPDPYPITRDLIEDGRRHLLLGAPIALNLPIHILHGMADADVPWTHALKLVEQLQSSDVTLELIKGGDHRLSTPPEIARLETRIEQMLARL